jgi:hypothetical protein
MGGISEIEQASEFVSIQFARRMNLKGFYKRGLRG